MKFLNYIQKWRQCWILATQTVRMRGSGLQMSSFRGALPLILSERVPALGLGRGLTPRPPKSPFLFENPGSAIGERHLRRKDGQSSRMRGGYAPAWRLRQNSRRYNAILRTSITVRLMRSLCRPRANRSRQRLATDMQLSLSDAIPPLKRASSSFNETETIMNWTFHV